MIQQPVEDHFLYPSSNPSEADAVAWVFTCDKGDPVKYPFIFPPLENDEVRIQVHYVGLCQSDCSYVRLKWSEYITFPACPGHEIIGQIQLLGSDVHSFKQGDMVACNPQRGWCGHCEQCLKGNNNLCPLFEGIYEPYFGGYATHLQIQGKAVFPLPIGLKLEQAAPLLCAGATVFTPLRKYGRPGIHCAVLGIGGLGHLAIKYASKMGMKVTAFTTNLEDTDTLMSLGASFVKCSTNYDQLRQNEGKYSIVINTINADDEKLQKVFQRLTKTRGTFVQLGIPSLQTQFKLDFMYLTYNSIRVIGSFIANYQDTLDTLNYSQEYDVYPMVELFDFEHLPEAFKKMEQGKPRFRCVVDMVQKQNI